VKSVKETAKSSIVTQDLLPSKTAPQPAVAAPAPAPAPVAAPAQASASAPAAQAAAAPADPMAANMSRIVNQVFFTSFPVTLFFGEYDV
jgi:hypothetical protein